MWGNEWEKLLKDLSDGILNVELFDELYESVRDVCEVEKGKLIDRLLCYMGTSIQQDIFLYSFILKLSKDVTYLSRLLELVLSDNSLDWKQLYFLHEQINQIIFVNHELSNNNIEVSNWKLLQKIYGMCRKTMELELTPIPREKRNKELAVVIIQQFLGEGHGPSKVALDRCSVLRKMGKRVLLINTAELLTMQGRLPFFEAGYGNYFPHLLECQTVSWQGETFQYYQCEDIMPDEEEINSLINAVKRLKPCVVVEIGGSSLVAGLINEMIPVLNVGTVLCCSKTLARYQAVSSNILEEANSLVKAVGKDSSHIIQGRFTYSFEKQTDFLKREDLGIDEDAFVLVVVGWRLDEEMNESFMKMLDETLRDNMRVVIIGKCDSYEQKLSNYPGLMKYMINFGICPDLLSRLELCDLYINPTRRGGGTSAVQAMFKGKPVITVSFGDVAGIVGDRFSCRDYNEMSQLIDRYYEDKAFYNEQSRYAQQLADIYMDSDKEFVRIIGEYETRID